MFPFSGDKRYLEAWLAAVEAKARAKAGGIPTDNMLISEAKMSIDLQKGDAVHILGMQSCTKIVKWEDFKSLFRKMYMFCGDPYEPLYELLNLERKSDETRVAYIARSDKLIRDFKFALESSHWADTNRQVDPVSIAKLVSFGTLMRRAPPEIMPILKAMNFGPQHDTSDVLLAIESASAFCGLDRSPSARSKAASEDWLADGSSESRVSSRVSSTRSTQSSQSTRSTRPACFYCGKKSHNERDCWYKEPRYKAGNTRSGQPPRGTWRGTRPTCTYCGKGHNQRDCWFRPRANGENLTSADLPYCTYHQMSGHSTSACRARRRAT